MGDLQIKKPPKVYDVVNVVSGARASGAHERRLTLAGTAIVETF